MPLLQHFSSRLPSRPQPFVLLCCFSLFSPSPCCSSPLPPSLFFPSAPSYTKIFTSLFFRFSLTLFQYISRCSFPFRYSFAASSLSSPWQKLRRLRIYQEFLGNEKKNRKNNRENQIKENRKKKEQRTENPFLLKQNVAFHHYRYISMGLNLRRRRPRIPETNMEHTHQASRFSRHFSRLLLKLSCMFIYLISRM